ncbi:MAG: hypothetical protein V4649_19675 [Bacteroidota bacterium]
MRSFLSVILIAILAAVAEYFLPWWTIAIVPFLVSLLTPRRPGRAFLIGFWGIAIFWLIAALIADVSNEHILSRRMAALFHLPGYFFFIIVSVLIGGLIGGMSSAAAAYFKDPVKGRH